MARTVSLDGPGWQVKGFLGIEAADVAARRAWDEAPGWLPATVPGSVVADLWRAGAVPDPYHELNSLAIEWVPERAWLYRRRLDPSDLAVAPQERAWLRFEGIDHAGRVFLDGEPVGRHEGMFVPFELDVADRLRDRESHTLAVLVEPAPQTEPQTGRTSRVRIHKSRMTYGWDFCPRMIHQGIWQPVRLDVAGLVRITGVHARPALAADLSRARVAVVVEFDLAAPVAVEVAAELAELPGVTARASTAVDLPAGASTVVLELDVADPPLWWPNGHGSAPVGRLVVRAAGPDGDRDQRSMPIGFRRVELVDNEGAPHGARPYTFAVNGRRLYAKGWNWVPHDVLHGVPRPDRIDHLTRLLAGAHVNLVRVWGGGLIETPTFYDACDRRGIMVWQEFIQSSSGMEDTPSADSAFVDLMTREAEAIVPLRRNHPSLVLWCGGNELQDEAGPLDEGRSPVLRALRDVVTRLDPDRAWLPTSPTGPTFHNRLDTIAADPDGLHDVHGPWEHQGLAAQYALWNRGTSLLTSEFGVEGMANRRAHEALVSSERRLPVDRHNPVYRHLGDWWINESHVRTCFGGGLAELEQLRRASQTLQAEGLRYAIEANRRRWPRNSGSIPWQFNEPYPFAFSTCAVDHRGDPKLAWFAVRRAYAPILVTAAFDRMALDGASAFDAAIWAWSELEALAAARVTATVLTPDGARVAESAWTADLDQATPRHVGELHVPFEGPPPDLFLLELRLTDASGTVRSVNRYPFSGTANLGPLLELPPARVEVDAACDDSAWTLRLVHTGGPAALGLAVSDDRPSEVPGWAEPDDGGFHLLPGEERHLAVRWADAPRDGRRLVIGGWNVDPIVLD